VTSSSRIYVTGHRNPDADSIASAIGYAELKRRLDPGNDYVAVRLGDVNAQTEWLLERSGAPLPELLPHIMLRVRDVMREAFAVARAHEPVREVGLTLAREGLDLVPVVDDESALVGIVSERTLAHRYIRESREASTLVDAPTTVGCVADVLEGELVTGDPDQRVAGRVWVHAMEVGAPTKIAKGDTVVVGNRSDAQRLAIELGAALLIVSNGSAPAEEIVALARERGTAVILSPLDTYVSGRMVTLSAPCRALMDADPLTVSPDDLISDIADPVKDIDYRAAVAVDGDRRPRGLVTRSDLVGPAPRRVVLVDHAEQAQSVIGVQQAEIMEILDHHHIGSIETRIPVTATFDPVGSTATLVIERFRQNGLEPSPPTATMLLGAILSDTVILNSPTTTERDHAVIRYLERVLAVDATEFGREMFEATSDVSEVPAAEIVARDAKEYELAGGQTMCIAQIETVGDTLLERTEELLGAMTDVQRRRGYVFFALMITDILSHGTALLVVGDRRPVERAFGTAAQDGSISLPGVMSRKKQVAPKLLGVS
jgi:manganese-dependent inorganic pyrophosphatase